MSTTRRCTNRRYRVDRRRIAQRIRRCMNGSSELRFAKKCHINASNLNRFFNQGAGIGLEQLVRISRATGRSMDWLVGLR